jgi:hypothetical protein
MRVNARSYFPFVAIRAAVLNCSPSMLIAQDVHFHGAPASSNHLKNPYAGQPAAAAAGSRCTPRTAAVVTELGEAEPAMSLRYPKARPNQQLTEMSFGSSQPEPSITVCRLGPA